MKVYSLVIEDDWGTILAQSTNKKIIIKAKKEIKSAKSYLDKYYKVHIEEKVLIDKSPDLLWLFFYGYTTKGGVCVEPYPSESFIEGKHENYFGVKAKTFKEALAKYKESI